MLKAICRFLLVGILCLAIHGVPAMAKGPPEAWKLKQRSHETDSNYSIHEILQRDSNDAARLAIQRTTAREYVAERFAVAVFSFDRPLADGLPKPGKNWSEVTVAWSVDGGDPMSKTGLWAKKTIRMPLTQSEFGAWQTGATLRVKVGSSSDGPQLAFDLSGLGVAFAQIEHAVPTVEDGSEAVLAGIDSVSNPTLIPESKVDPVFPEDARRERASGQVILSAIVRSNGSVDSIVVIQCNNPGLGFEEAAREAVRHWRYRPGTKNGQPVDVLFTIVIDFSLR